MTICRNNIKVWLGHVSSCSSHALVRFCSWMEWQMGWIWWTILVSFGFWFLYHSCNVISFIWLVVIIFLNEYFSIHLIIYTGTLLYLLFHLFVIWQHSHSREFSITSSHHLDKTVASMSFLLPWPWFLHLFLP